MIYLLSILVLLRVSYWLFIFVKLALYKTNNSLNHTEGVSVVICVKNNKLGIQKLLTKLLKQNHQNYDILIVDDFSTDGLKEYCDTLASKLVKYIKADIDRIGKKAALSQGVKSSTKEWILVTDSDCMPSSLDWISLMVGSAISQKKDIILGYAPLGESKGLAAIVAKYETAYIGMQYLSYALAHKPYMGVGRNMLYNKNLFLQSNAFDDNMDIASGDDDFFIQKAASYENTGIFIDKNALCCSNPPANFNAYLNQKTRHISTANRYKKEYKYLLGLFGFLHVSIYFTMVFCFIFKLIKTADILSIWLLMIAVISTIQYICFNKLNEQRAMLNFILSDILLSLLYSIVGVKTIFGKNIKWS